MSFSVELLQEHMAVPFVPTLGVVHPLARRAAIEGVLSSASSDIFLPYDKDRRWFDKKAENVLPELIKQSESATIIPTINNSSKLVKVYHYSRLHETWGELSRQHQSLLPHFAGHAIQTICFSDVKDAACQAATVFIAEKEIITAATHRNVVELKDLPRVVAQTLPRLAEGDIENSGFPFLWEQFAQDKLRAPVLVTVDGNEITGAVGPLEIMVDAIGKVTRYPVFFGVSINARRKGSGSELWKAAISWAHSHDVEYRPPLKTHFI